MLVGVDTTKRAAWIVWYGDRTDAD